MWNIIDEYFSTGKEQKSISYGNCRMKKDYNEVAYIAGLSEIGYDIPRTIYNKEQLNRVLAETPRLIDNDVQTYINKILGR